MSKNIIICLDGTGNHFNHESSNIVTLTRVLIKSSNKQMVYYDPGVGTLSDPNFHTPLFKAISIYAGLAFGRGIINNVEKAYLFLMETYKDGDKIFIFGFSRGAYTARVLAGLIHGCGLLDKSHKNLLPHALNIYKKTKLDFEILNKFKKTFSRKCQVELLGLWDTVSSIGWFYNPRFFPFTTNNQSVRAVRHALSIDEKRILFRPLFWGNKFLNQQDVKECWFPGMHSDIGGGYLENESGLSKLSLKWMIQEIRSNKFNVLVDDDKYKKYVLGKDCNNVYCAPNIHSPMHETLTGVWLILQYLPVKTWNNEKKKKQFMFVKQYRNIEKGALIHKSAVERFQSGYYHPKNIDLGYTQHYKLLE